MTLPLSPGTWNVDPAHTVVGFAVRHLGISAIRGRFGDVAASVAVGEDLSTSALTAEIDMSSIDTGNPDRDGHVRSSDFFSLETHPKMSFVSTGITASGGDGFRVAGNLTINGHTQPETLDVEMFGLEDNPFDGTRRAGFAATGRINRVDYGIDWQVPLASGGIMLGQEIDLVIDAQLVGPSESEAG